MISAIESRYAALVFALAAIALAAPSASADEIADFYRGRTIQLVVGYGPGGGNDVYARLLARHMPRHIAGAPGIVVQNMPGAGSLVAANYLANVAPKDGTVIATFARNLPLASVVDANPNIRFDARRLTWLGSASSYAGDAYILWVRPDARTSTLDAAMKPGGAPLVLAGTSEGDTSYDVPVVLRQALAMNIKLIGGYRDSNGMFQAIEGGEVDGRFADLASVASSRAHWLQPGAMLTMLQFGRATRHPDFPAVPTARERAPNDEARALIELMEAPFAISRPYAAPPGIPAPRAKALQTAFMAMQVDPAYLAEAQRLQLDVSPIGADEVQRLLARIDEAPAAIKAQARKILGAAKGG